MVYTSVQIKKKWSVYVALIRFRNTLYLINENKKIWSFPGLTCIDFNVGCELKGWGQSLIRVKREFVVIKMISLGETYRYFI